jgi:hypothetical protein
MKMSSNLPDSIASRRAFLGGLGAAGAVGVSHSFTGGLLGSSATSSLHEGPAGKLLPNYVYGEVAGSSEGNIAIKLPSGYSPDEIRIRITSKTEICRLGCGRQWRTLKRGDRVEVGYQGALGAGATASWINANPVYNYGFVTDLGITTESGPGTAKAGWPRVTTVINRGNYSQQEFHRDVIVGPGTTVVLANGRSSQGSTRGIQRGDFITFTATADLPYLRCRKVWAQVIHQFEHE